ncbi:ATP-binding protein [Algoriphagus sp.]|uniref:ATP-binding protein n=1 Tax=Algoriphagus sp. TaxID=1872435 RepID=UPI0027218B7C|nr:ATP-binding protein [Algoriphagus sp.]MDO8968302.1 ATP-binding protein [Algoriphagus sp.]MDP3200097.1 ATP-binding protein [Algoriphagus sp.]
MLLRHLPAVLLTVSLFLVQGFLAAQNFKFNTQPRGVRLNVQNVLQVEQDTLGRMWFSTGRGVVYSDGIETYELPDTLTRRFVYKIGLLKDEDGILWIYNASGVPTVLERKPNAWSEFQFSDSLKSYFSSKIHFFSIGKSTEKLFFLETGRDLVVWKNGERIERKLCRDISATGHLLAVSEVADKILLIFKNGTFELKNGELFPYQFRGVPLPSSPVLIKKSPSGTYYFLGKDYLASGPAAEFPTEIIDQDFSTINFVEEDYFSLVFSGENVFYHYNSHLKKYNPTRKRPVLIDLSSLFRAVYIQTAFIDREGLLWVGTSRGIGVNNSQVFQNYGIDMDAFLAEEFTASIESRPGEFLFGFNNGVQKMSRFDVETLYQGKDGPQTPNERIINFSKDKNGVIWASANFKGLGKIVPNYKRVSFLPIPEGLNVSSVQAVGDSLLITSPKRVFISSITADNSEFFKKELTSEILKLLGDVAPHFRKSGKLSNGKLVVLRASRLENQYPIIETPRYFLAEGYDFLEMEDGSILLGTEFGLKIYREGYVGFFIYAGRSITRPIYTLMKDKDGKIWAGTDNGVFVFGEDKIIQYDESNGLIGNEVNRGALIEAASGRVLIGTMKGLSIYFPEETFFAYGAPKAFVKSMKLGNREILSSEEFKVPYDQNSLEVEFIAPGFNESKELWVHHRLIRGDEETPWEIVKDPRSNQLFFSNLPSGSYRLEFKTSYNGLEFSDTFRSKEFEILSPFYLRPWFIVFTVLLLVALGILINTFFKQLQNLGILQSAVERENKSKVIAEQQFKNVWNSSQDGMILTLENERILTVNPAFARMMRSDIKKLENQPLAVLFNSKTSQNFYLDTLLNRARNSPGQGVSVEAELDWKSGHLEMEVFSVMLDQDKEGKSLVLSVFKDISAQKNVQNKLKDAKEKAEQANRFKSSLLSNISHEIRTPLNGIIGGAEHIIMTKKEDLELVSQLDIILQSGERLLGTINSLLDLAKMEANKFPIEYVETDVKNFVETVMKPLQAAADRKGLHFAFRFLSPAFHAKIDRRFMEMILNNIVSNSIKYTEKGLITVICEKKDKQLILEVTDTGVGMSENFQSKMFDPFEQESKGHDRLFEGTGLGLSITKNLVQLLDGKIDIQSIKNSGTRVIVEIPLPEA